MYMNTGHGRPSQCTHSTGVFAAGYVQVEGCAEAPDEATLRYVREASTYLSSSRSPPPTLPSPACPHPPIKHNSGNLMSSLSDHVAFFLGTHGPSLTLETACSSSLVALAMAVAALRKGDCDYAIVTCVNIPQDKDFHLSLQVRVACIHTGVPVLRFVTHASRNRPTPQHGLTGVRRAERHRDLAPLRRGRAQGIRPRRGRYAASLSPSPVADNHRPIQSPN